MTITAPQRLTILKLWGSVCKDRGWKTSDRELRLRTFSELVGRPLASTDEVERLDECTKLMNELKAMLGVSIKAGLEATDPTLNQARVLRNRILTDLVPCLELYLDDVRGYVTKIIQDKNRWTKTDRPTCELTVMDLTAKPIIRETRSGGLYESPSQLHQVLFTLTARLNDLRNDAGDTIHQMRTKAGLDCTCAQCRPRRAATVCLGEDSTESQVLAEQPF